MFEEPWLRELWARTAPTEGGVSLDPAILYVVLGVAAVGIGAPPLWRVLRVAITLVHELGHALVGVLVGRKFTGFVVRGDMSGHAVTKGPARGFGRVITTWAGYPAPAVVGAGLAWLGANGWAAPAIAACLGVLIVSLVRVRSLLTALVMFAAIAATAALWWFRDDALQAPVLLGAGTVLVVGAWRHLAAVWGSGGRSSDPGVLAQLTRVPAFLWNTTFALVCLAASAVVGLEFWTVLRPS
ncbi:M50 family metallopeptidase [Pseudoclavibacter endophyticus]|uniref:M50 family metallopeptidase n=1 Tax=Pseudoclavibacter endophyticus TaxID=1778590 RepID=A0A6H9WUN3_9MICO|nr:M50 family metallopeptidase [Pseudoclavibacter endophyticus]